MSLFFCPLYSGSSGNSTFIAAEDTAILIDAGVSAKRIEEGLQNVGAKFDDIDAIIITHEHIDHINGIGVIARRHGIPIYANSGTWDAILNGGRVGEIPYSKRIRFEDRGSFFVGDINISPFPIPHDAASPVGFSISNQDSRIVTATDMGYMPESVLNIIIGADVLQLEFNYDEHMLNNGSYPYMLKQRILSNKGHLSNDISAKVLIKAIESGCRNFMLAHLSRENNTPEAAYDAACRELFDVGLKPGESLQIQVAPADRIGKAFFV